MKTVFKRSAWFVKAYNILPEFLRPAYCFSARVQHNTTDYVHFEWKPKKQLSLFAALALAVLAFVCAFFAPVISTVMLVLAVVIVAPYLF